MPIYVYECCGNSFERLLPMEARDSVSCTLCGKQARRLVSTFNAINTTHVGTSSFRGVEHATGTRGIETYADAQKALTETHTEMVEPYYRPPPPPQREEITLAEINKYLDGMPLENS